MLCSDCGGYINIRGYCTNPECRTNIDLDYDDIEPNYLAQQWDEPAKQALDEWGSGGPIMDLRQIKQGRRA